MKKILIGTHNKGKLKEIKPIWLSKKYKKISPLSDLNIKSPKQKQVKPSSLENSKLKANYFFKLSKTISVISDDSGLMQLKHFKW